MAKQISRILCILMFAAAVAPAAQAQFMDTGFYFEIGLGRATFKDTTLADWDAFTRNGFAGDNRPVQTLSSSLHARDRSYTLISGYRINPYLSFEAGYFRPGAFQYSATGTVKDVANGGAILPASLFYSYRAKGFLIGGTATLPLGKLVELRGRAGFTSTDTRVRFTAVAGGGIRGQDQFSENSQDFYFGAGVGMKVWNYYRLGVDLMRHNNLGKADSNGSYDVDNILVSFSYMY